MSSSTIRSAIVLSSLLLLPSYAQEFKDRPFPGDHQQPLQDWPDLCQSMTFEELARGGSESESRDDPGRDFDEQWALSAVSADVDNESLRRLQDIAAQRYSARPLPDPGLDLEGFVDDVAAVLDGNVMGYAVMAKRGLEPAVSRVGGWAKTPRDGNVRFSTKTSLHLASTSKTITALAVVRLLRENGIALSAPIVDYLPDYWAVGPGVDKIRFLDLLSHRTGLACPGAGSPGFEWARVRIERGISQAVSEPPSARFNYENLHYTLLRILMATVSGEVAVDWPEADGNDGMWNARTSAFYDAYVKSIVLRPSEVRSAELNPRDSTALAYQSANLNDATNTGWNSRDKRGRAGSIGWHASPEELLRLAHAVRNGVVVTPNELSSMQVTSRGFLYDTDFTPIGVYRHGGTWGTGDPGKRESNIMYFAPGGQGQNRTADTRIFSPLLYQLSYLAPGEA